jgi:hypothetical protein
MLLDPTMSQLAEPDRWSQIVVVLDGLYAIITVWGPSLSKFLTSKPQPSQESQIESLARDLPNYCHPTVVLRRKRSNILERLASCRMEEPLVDELYTFVLHIGGMTFSGRE